MAKQRVLSGIQTSGQLHLGNYLGALKPFVALQDDYDCYFFLADLHALTVPQDPAALRRSIYHIANVYLACGLNPKKATLFRQSDVPAHAELGWILTTLTTMGELKRMTQFKDKSGQAKAASVGAGLFTYPALQAADILLYQADLVPVGDDQKQHVELTRDLAERFNHRFGQTLKVPVPLIQEHGARIMGLDDPTKKMSKSARSDLNYIALSDEPDVIRKKIQKAVTDSGAEVKGGPRQPALNNLLTIYSLLTERPIATIERDYHGKGYGEFKRGLAEVVIETLTPIREKLIDLDRDSRSTKRILEDGAVKAGRLANETLARAKQAVGLD